jgi:hypothetical protein
MRKLEHIMIKQQVCLSTKTDLILGLSDADQEVFSRIARDMADATQTIIELEVKGYIFTQHPMPKFKSVSVGEKS